MKQVGDRFTQNLSPVTLQLNTILFNQFYFNFIILKYQKKKHAFKNKSTEHA